MLALRYFVLATFMALFVYGCRHPLVIIGEGDILSQSGNRNCTLELYEAGMESCTNNRVRRKYNETYTAVARDGWQFSGWNNCYDKSPTDNQCNFKVGQEYVELAKELTAPPLTAFFRREIAEGYEALFLGHSFFIPLVPLFEDFAHLAGYTGQNIQTVEAGNENGSAQLFWYNEDANHHEIKRILDEGGLTLVGMTHHFVAEIDGYRNWINYALESNPGAAFFITMPWLPGPFNGSPEETAEMEDTFSHLHNYLHSMIEQLRLEFPDTNIFCIPYGEAGLELRKLFLAGELPELDALATGEGYADGPLEGVHIDPLGHADKILNHLASLIMLHSVYGVDLVAFDYQSLPQVGYKFADADVAGIAQRIFARHDHRYDSQ